MVLESYSTILTASLMRISSSFFLIKAEASLGAYITGI